MQHKTLGDTGLSVSCIGFGAIPIMDHDEDYSIRLVRRAIDLGINYFDTARAYKDTESKLGKAIKGHRNEVILATKTHVRSYKQACESIDESLRLLDVDMIDIYQLHGIDSQEEMDKVLSTDGAYRALAEAQKQGKIRFLGITSHEPSFLVKVLKQQQAHFDVILVRYSINNKEQEHELFGLAKKIGVGIALMKTLNGGLLAIPKDVAQLRIDGESLGIAQGAVKYALASDFGDTVVVGLGSEKELEEISSLGNEPQSFDNEYIEKLTGLAEQVGKGFCLQCGYCKSACLEEIDIPLIFKAQIYKEKFGRQRCTMWTPESIKSLTEKCSDCGKCIPECPNNLNIPELIRKVRLD